MGERGEEIEPAKPPCLHRFSMIPVPVFLVVLLFVVSTVAFSLLRLHVISSSTPRESDLGRAFFIFGDSYADVGNIPFGPARNSPYGVTWPGHPAGRFSDGFVQSDYLATQVIGRPSPPAFADSSAASLFEGVNFAVGGAGLTYAYGAPNISTQVSWFEAVVNSRIYTKEFLASSVALLCVSGNDYGAYRGPIKNYRALAAEVVELIDQSLRKLHSLGLRNIMVTTVAPLNCLPLMTQLMNFTACSPNATVEDVISHHNSFLETTLGTLSNDLPEVNFILLRQDEALRHILTKSTLFDISHPFKPCCFGLCGIVDSVGNLLYTKCANPGIYALWDDVHPTQAAWENVVNLYVNDQAFTKFAPTLKHWTQNLL